MSSLTNWIFPAVAFISLMIILDGVYFLFFYYTSFPSLKKEWLIFAQRFDFITIIKPYGHLGWVSNIRNQPTLEASGIVQDHPVHCYWNRRTNAWNKRKRSEFGEFVCKIEIKNPHKVAFLLKKEMMLIGKKNLEFETPYFKKNFNISTNNVGNISQVFNEEIQNKVRRIFSIELDANLTIEETKNKTNTDDTILDSSNNYSLVYFNPNFQINNKRQNIFIQETLLSMLNIAQRIDAIA